MHISEKTICAWCTYVDSVKPQQVQVFAKPSNFMMRAYFIFLHHSKVDLPCHSLLHQLTTTLFNSWCVVLRRLLSWKKISFKNMHKNTGIHHLRKLHARIIVEEKIAPRKMRNHKLMHSKGTCFSCSFDYTWDIYFRVFFHQLSSLVPCHALELQFDKEKGEPCRFETRRGRIDIPFCVPW